MPNNTIYNPSSIAAVIQDYQQLKQTYRNNPQNRSALGAIASQLRVDLFNLSLDVYPDSNILAREVRYYALHPFAKAWILYIIAFIVMLAVTLFPTLEFYDAAIGTLVLVCSSTAMVSSKECR